MKKNNIDKEINFYFCLSLGNQKCKVKGKKNDILKCILDKCIQDEGLVKNFKNMSVTALMEGNLIYIEKSIEENNIKEGSCIIILLNDKEETPEGSLISKEKKENFEEKESDMEFESLLQIIDDINDIFQKEQQILYESFRLNSHCQKNKNDNELKPQFTSKKHKHGLVYLFSNSEWICNLCYKIKSEIIPKYYCSICNYNLCDNCIGDEKKYPLKHHCHEQTKLKSFKFPFHQHKLIYCRTSRHKDQLTPWTCDICDTSYSDKIWSFYCTFCDYDLCLNCLKKYFSSDELVNNIGIKIDEHEHLLVYMLTNKNWICNLCYKDFDSTDGSYCCTNCLYNVCKHCMEQLSDEQKYPFFSDGKRLDCDINNVKLECHEHPLIYCITSRTRIPTSWYCDNCLEKYGIQDWSFFCSICNYDICFQCYKNFLEK